jgi:hypothetical protein
MEKSRELVAAQDQLEHDRIGEANPWQMKGAAPDPSGTAPRFAYLSSSLIFSSRDRNQGMLKMWLNLLSGEFAD